MTTVTYQGPSAAYNCGGKRFPRGQAVKTTADIAARCEAAAKGTKHRFDLVKPGPADTAGEGGPKDQEKKGGS